MADRRHVSQPTYQPTSSSNKVNQFFQPYELAAPFDAITCRYSYRMVSNVERSKVLCESCFGVALLHYWRRGLETKLCAKVLLAKGLTLHTELCAVLKLIELTGQVDGLPASERIMLQ